MRAAMRFETYGNIDGALQDWTGSQSSRIGEEKYD